MAVYTLLSLGGPYTLTQNTIYALPCARVMITVGAGGGTVNIAAIDSGTFSAVTLTNQAFETSADFVKATGADTIITLSRT